MSGELMSKQVFEATLTLAPEKARQALMTMTAASNVFLFMHGRLPSDEAMIDRFIREAMDLECTDDEIQWLVDAEILEPEDFDKWKAATREHA